MSIPGPIMTYNACTPEEKLRRLRYSYTHGTLTLEQLEAYTLEALEEAYQLRFQACTWWLREDQLDKIATAVANKLREKK